jgi:hypothetical protein
MRSPSQNRKDAERADAPETVAAREAKKRAEFDRGVRVGWWDQDGAPLPQPDRAADDDDDALDGEAGDANRPDGGGD